MRTDMTAAMNTAASKKRIKWMDVMKCFGIFAIYLGHFGPDGGYSYDFVFTHHVALFFFVSGCTEALSASDRKIVPYIQKRIRTLLVPYFFFGVLSIVFYTLTANASARNARGEFIRMLEGAVRNSFCAGGLWFLTCLFVVQIMFVLLYRICPKWLLLLISAGMAFIAYAVMDPSPIQDPGLFYNVDSALYFFFYYVLGYLLFPFMEKLFRNIPEYRLPVTLFSALCLVYATLLYFKYGYLMRLFQIPVFGGFLFNIQPLLIIWLYAVVSRWLQDVRIFNEVGKETLYLCGSEYLIKTGIQVVLLSLGFTMDITSPMAAYLYSALMIWIGMKWLIPLERELFRRAGGVFAVFFMKSEASGGKEKCE